MRNKRAKELRRKAEDATIGKSKEETRRYYRGLKKFYTRIYHKQHPAS